MIPLNQDLQIKKKTLEEFELITIRVLQHLPNVISAKKEKSGYIIYSSDIAGTKKFVRPIKKILFIDNISDFQLKFNSFTKLIDKIKNKDSEWTNEEEMLINSIVYTMQQAIGAGLDLLVDQNSARKHVGNRFEELIQALFKKIQITNTRTVLQIPYETDEGFKIYKCENDLILSPYDVVKSTNYHLDENEVVVSVKTTSKDRMGKMFIDKILLQRFVKHKQKVIGIFLNDVQRKKSDNISYTLVSGLFMVYSRFLTELDGIYYLDPPPNALKAPYNKYMKPFSKLLTTDIWHLLVP